MTGDVHLHRSESEPMCIPHVGCHCWLCSLVREFASLKVKTPAPFHGKDRP